MAIARYGRGKKAGLLIAVVTVVGLAAGSLAVFADQRSSDTGSQAREVTSGATVDEATPLNEDDPDLSDRSYRSGEGWGQLVLEVEAEFGTGDVPLSAHRAQCELKADAVADFGDVILDPGKVDRVSFIEGCMSAQPENLNSESVAGTARERLSTALRQEERADVRRVQRCLNLLGYGMVTADGHYGPETAEAVRAFQSDYGLYVDGIVGPDTWKRLCR